MTLTKVTKVLEEKDQSPKTILEKFSFKLAVEFGRPSKDCENYGICRLELIESEDPIEPKLEKKPCNSVVVNASYNRNTKDLELIFLKSLLKSPIQKKHFATDFFKVEEIYQNTLLIKDADLFLDIVIEPGFYPIVDRVGAYVLRFAKSIRLKS